MNSPTPGPSWLRTALRTLWLVPLAALGFLLAANPHRAAADGLPIPTITVPSLPVTLPTLPLLPTTTAGSTSPTTTAPVTTTGASSTASTAPTTPTTRATGTGAADTTAVVGARRLANGTVSIPVTSVSAPARLVVVVSVQPRRILRAVQVVKASVEVRDTRGYLVRGAAVAIGSVPAGKLVPVHQKRSAVNGRAVFLIRLRSGNLRPGTFLLRVRASNPAAPTATAATREIQIVVKAKG